MFLSKIRAALSYIAPSMDKLRALLQKAFGPKFLVLTNVTISLSLSAAGDMLEQAYEKYAGELEMWDKRRTFNMAISGASDGFLCHYWYLHLDRRLPGSTLDVVAKKLILDQLLCSPLYIFLFFITMGLLESQTKEEIWEEVKYKAWKLYLADWFIWPPAQFFNFLYLPTKYRVFYDNLISMALDVYASNVKYSI